MVFYSNRWLTTILLSEDSKVSREDLRLNLELDNIESRPVWKPVIYNLFFLHVSIMALYNVEHLFRYGLCLPSGSNMIETDLRRIITNIKRSFEK